MSTFLNSGIILLRYSGEELNELDAILIASTDTKYLMHPRKSSFSSYSICGGSELTEYTGGAKWNFGLAQAGCCCNNEGLHVEASLKIMANDRFENLLKFKTHLS